MHLLSAILCICSCVMQCNSPLNSDDDIEGDDDDPEASDFETRDTMVCQWEKVSQPFIELLLS